MGIALVVVADEPVGESFAAAIFCVNELKAPD